jgi:hypothetical protein
VQDSFGGNTLASTSARSSTVGVASTMHIGKDIPLAHVHRYIERLRRAGSHHRQQMWSMPYILFENPADHFCHYKSNIQ